MAPPPSSSRPWRARAFHLTRDRWFLIKGVFVILGVFVFLASCVHLVRTSTARPVKATAAEEDAQMTEEFRRLEIVAEPQPDRFTTWVRQTAAILAETEPRHRPAFDPAALKLGEFNLEPVVRKHASSADAYPLFSAYVRCLFASPDMDMQTEREMLIHAAGQRPAVRHAGEFLGDFYFFALQPAKAIPFYLQESLYVDAQHCRRMALQLALQEQDQEVLRELASNPMVVAEAHAAQLRELANQLDDRKLAFRATVALELARWSEFSAVSLALFAAAIWYLILVHSGRLDPHRWVRYLPPLLAGVASVMVLHWLQISMEYAPMPSAADNPTKQMVHWVLYVGMPEEACKILLFALFLPILLKARSGRQAALTAGCVGLGFALNENIAYFTDHDSQVATVRLLTANVLHFSLTGILGYHLYVLVRSRFHHATNFLLAFLGVSAAHGLYNFAGSAIGLQWEIDIAHIIIVALAARMFFQMLHEGHEPSTAGNPISRTCVFWFGAALLVGVLMIPAVIHTQSLSGITDTLSQAVALVPVALLYQHEFNEVRR
ncbi:PrsW family glutamic-type intramembrane protease [Verrucomicrobium sp. BvORR106]|uniref:PrsW family glutamic-type intramembrane protease n=1 Tax=Verrucomicrobium sp. BvORR106 TaxID=1403819 RepID=UPI00056F3CF2|nr:PrsW family glutamic-type intramembrane protease [Verrucomicrobium sp. BvORR106]